MANADPAEGAASRGLRARLTVWLPVLVVYSLILLTIPYGSLISQLLYRLEPDIIRSSRPVPPGIVELRDLSGGTFLRDAEGRVFWLATADAAAPAPVPLPAPCLQLGFGRDLWVSCAMGPAGTAILDVGQGGTPEVRVVPGVATSSLPIGDELLVGGPAGQLTVWGKAGEKVGEIVIGAGPVTGMIAQAGQAAVMVGSEMVLVDPAELAVERAVLARVDLGAPGGAPASVLTDVYTFVGDRVLIFDTSDPRNPRQIATLEAGGPVREIHPALQSIFYVRLDGDRVRHLRSTMYGTYWWGGDGWRARACAGGWGEVVCVTPEHQLVRYDILPSRHRVVFAVGIIGGLLFLTLIASVVWRRTAGWPWRLLWAVVILGALGWILSETWKIPIEALHILEYATLGALAYRAIGMGGRGGLTAALLAVGVGALAGLGDEFVQWTFPTRTGSIEDVLLDTRAAALGALLGWLSLQLATAERPQPWSRVALFGAALSALVAIFLQCTAHFGHTWQDGPYTVHSRLTFAEFRAMDTEARGAELAGTTTLRYDDYLRKFRKDPWLYEMRVHIYRRDRYVQKGDWNVACAEQRLLTRLAPIALSRTAYAWGPAQTASCQNIPEEPYVSPVGDDLLTQFSPLQMWTLSAILTAFLASLGGFSARRSGRR